MRFALLLHFSVAMAATVKVAIQSAAFRGSYLRIDGGGVTAFAGSGGGYILPHYLPKPCSSQALERSIARTT